MATGCYRPQYLQAAYGDIPFTAIEVTSEHGRRGDEGEFIFGEDTAYADLGRRIRVYTMRARFQENSHIADAQRLIDVCERPGPKTFVHPTRGVILSVACRKARITDRVETEQGVTHVDLELVEANQILNGVSVVLFQPGALNAAGFIGTVGGWFGANFDPAIIQTYRIGAVQQGVSSVSGTLLEAFTEATTSLPGDVRRYRAVQTIQSLVAGPFEEMPVSEISEITIKAISAVRRYSDDGFDLLRRIANSASFATDYAEPAQGAISAYQSMVRLAAAAEMAVVTSSGGATATEKLARMEIVDAIFRQELEIARAECEYCLSESIKGFRTSALSASFSRAYDAQAESVYQFGGSVHPLAASYAIHCDAKRHRETEALNQVGAMGLIGREVVGRAA